MKEFTFKIGPEKLAGLRKHHTNQRNNGMLVDSMNNIVLPEGLIPYEVVTPLFENDYLFDNIPSVAWPFPQMLFGNGISILCFQTRIYTIDKTTIPWSTNLAYNFGFQPTWDEDNTWHIAEFYGTVILTNDITMLWYDQSNDAWIPLTGDENIPVMGTICNYRGQLFGGNFSTTWHGAGSSFVGWGEIGSFIMLPNKSNVAGFRPMPFKGKVRRVLPLDKAIIVYGEDGIAVMSPAGKAFAMKPLSAYGILTRDSVYGNDEEHIFIDDSGWLRRINKDLTITRLGYQEFFAPMIGESINIIYDDNEERHYISDGTITYLLTKSGLTKSYQIMPSGEYIQGAMVANIPRENNPDTEYRLTTDTFDLGYRGQKTIETIEVSSDQSVDCFGSIDYRYSKTADWATTREVVCNDEGVFRLPCAGVEFRFNLRFTDFIDVNLDYLNVKYKATDRRYTRGTSNAIANVA